MRANRLVVLHIVFIALSCSTQLDEEAYLQWIRDYENGLHVQKESGEYVFDVQYQPLDYILLQRGVNRSDSASVSDVVGLQYYTLTISHKDKTADFIDQESGGHAEKQRKLYYFSYLFQNDIHLEEDGRMLPCVLYHFERSMDLKNGRTFVIAFENRNKESKEAKLIVDSSAFGSFPVKFKISKENIPALAL